MTIIVSAFWIFIIAFFVLELVLYALNTIRYPNRSKIRKRLKRLSEDDFVPEPSDILRKRVLSDVRVLDRILRHIPGVQALDRLVQQANSKYSTGFYILFGLFLGSTGYLVGSMVVQNPFFAPIIGLALTAFPIFVLHRKKKQRMAKFQRQLPEALELVARALKAGHAFSSGLKLAADEFDDPLGPEFQAALDEINFGVSVTDALKNLTTRVDCPELRFFVVSVIVQRDTGGNLAEIIENLARLIRERFKFEGKVRVLSAEGKLSAMVLVALPFAITLVLQFINPDYMDTLFSEPSGRMVIGVAIITMLMGIIVIRKMIKIRV
jgi:tight adherence protein B